VPRSTGEGWPKLDGAFMFLSASFPSQDARGERFRPYDPGAISDAATAVARGVLGLGGRLVFGGHPTISPLVLHVASEFELHGQERVVIYQSREYAGRIGPATEELAARNLGHIEWVDEVAGVPAEDLDPQLVSLMGGRIEPESPNLRLLRQRMLAEKQPIGAFFIGGMDGIAWEWEWTARLAPRAIRVPIGQPGAAAARLVEVAQLGPLADEVRHSAMYAVIVRDALALMAQGA
jgi:SLOG-like protein